MSSIAAKKSCRRKVNIVRASLQATPHRNVGKDQAQSWGLIWIRAIVTN
jgi:hypothetical protein